MTALTVAANTTANRIGGVTSTTEFRLYRFVGIDEGSTFTIPTVTGRVPMVVSIVDETNGDNPGWSISGQTLTIGSAGTFGSNFNLLIAYE